MLNSNNNGAENDHDLNCARHTGTLGHSGFIGGGRYCGFCEITQQEATKDNDQSGNQSWQITDNTVEPAGKDISPQNVGGNREEKNLDDPENDLADND